MPHLRSLKAQFHVDLNAIYGKEEVSVFFHLLLEHHLNLDKVNYALNPSTELSQKQYQYFLEALSQLKQEMPIQYIIGQTEFYGLQFRVNEHVLIPRPETEELVDLIVQSIKPAKRLRILDIGTGSGCIAISLAKQLTNAEVYAMDVSNEALEMAKANALENDVDVTFYNMDILQWKSNKSFFDDIQFDVIVSNPPYVRQFEKAQMRNNVLSHEPHLALFVEDTDPLVFYRAICELAVDKLVPGGELYFEINQYLGSDMQGLLENFSFKNTTLKKDFLGNHRFIVGQFNKEED